MTVMLMKKLLNKTAHLTTCKIKFLEKVKFIFSSFLLVKRMAQAPMDSGHGLVHANHTVVGRPVVLIKDGCVWDP